MSDASAAPPRARPRQSLSGRLWLVTTLAVLLSEILVFLPYIAHERTLWLEGRIEDATIVVLAAANTAMDNARHTELLHLADTEAIQLTDRNGTVRIGNVGMAADASIDLRREGFFMRVRRAIRALLLHPNRLIRITDTSPYAAGTEVEMWLHEGGLGRALGDFAADFAVLALAIAGVAGGLVYLAVLALLVRPMRRLTGSIAAFRADPERTTPLDADNLTVLSDDEITIAGRELAAMQEELRTALWRNARLAALGTMVAKVSHDLRGILTPALLTAERLQLNRDARVAHAGEVLATAVERAADLVRRTLDYAREGPPPLAFTPVALAPLASEVAGLVSQQGYSVRLINEIAPDLVVSAERLQLFRVLSNLMRNAAEAGAKNLRISACRDGHNALIDIADDGPGLPDTIRSDLFRPFAGSRRRGGAGLGLAIVRDLMVAHGGDIILLTTGETGTTFRLTLRLADTDQSGKDGTRGERVAPATSADV